MSSCLLMLLLVLDERVEEMKTRGFQNVDRTRAAGQSTRDARLRPRDSRNEERSRALRIKPAVRAMNRWIDFVEQPTAAAAAAKVSPSEDPPPELQVIGLA
jgi:hypothetical protein